MRRIILFAFAGISVVAVGIYIHGSIRLSGREIYNDPKIYGCIPNEETALDVAEAIRRPVYGRDLNKYQPFRAKLKDSIWVITGDMHADFGGVIHMELGKHDCKVYKMYREK